MKYAFQMILYALVVMSGCSSSTAYYPLDEEFARMSEDERIRVCTSYYRDAKVLCREGMQDPAASHSFDCLSARMKIERFCLSPR
ncbi:MAG: hypothetical protein OER43_04920 [Gammaproteobacteria bacterium]|nr:hypothetical protein [Gammaproteobacteria bacterium]